MRRTTEVPCPHCNAPFIQTPSGYWTCPNNHTKLIKERELAHYAQIAYEKWLQSDEGKLAAQEITRRVAERLAKQEARAQAAKERRKLKRQKQLAAASLPACFRTRLRHAYKIEDHDGLFRHVKQRVKGAVRALDLARRKPQWFAPLTEDETNEMLAQIPRLRPIDSI